MKPIRDCWTLTVNRAGRTGTLAAIDTDRGQAVRVFADENGAHAELITHWADSMKKFHHDDDLVFRLDAPGAGDCLRLEWRGYSARLYDGDALADEDWVLGALIGGDWTLTQAEGVTAALAETAAFVPDEPIEISGSAQYFTLPGHNTHIGDCMPFEFGGEYHLFCLFDRRHHGSKKGLGAHQWAHLSTKDMKTWTWHPIAVGIDEQWEGSICTGSMIEKDGQVYAFYAARTSDGSPAKLTWAVSDDCIHFKKTGKFFTLSAPYEPTSARDPKLWRDAEGLYHMLVTTSLLDVKRGGCLAHLTSPDLENWTQHEPMIVPGYDDQPECSDYFEMNGLYYLVFSNRLFARYRVSDKPFGPWRRLRDDVLDFSECRVPKTSTFGGKRLITGWVTEGPWGGCIVTHELVQHADGTLGTRFIDALLPERVETIDAASRHIAAESGSGDALLLTARGDFRTKLRLTPEADNAGYGLELIGEGGSLRLELDSAYGTAQLMRGTDIASTPRCMTLTDADWCRKPFELELIVCGGVMEVQLPGDHIMMAGHTLTGPFELRAYARCPLAVEGV